MSFLTIAQDVAISVDFPSPATAFTSSDPAVRKCGDLLRRHPIRLGEFMRGRQ